MNPPASPHPRESAARPAPTGVSAPSPVLLFDGECGLCQGIVRRMLRHDRRGRLRFAPLQGAAAQAYLKAQGLPATDFDSLVFVPDWNQPNAGSFRLRTDGVLAALAETDGHRGLGSFLRLVPRFLRDAGYRLVARVRYFIFGSYRPRPLENPAWRERFIDGV